MSEVIKQWTWRTKESESTRAKWIISYYTYTYIIFCALWQLYNRLVNFWCNHFSFFFALFSVLFGLLLAFATSSIYSFVSCVFWNFIIIHGYIICLFVYVGLFVANTIFCFSLGFGAMYLFVNFFSSFQQKKRWKIKENHTSLNNNDNVKQNQNYVDNDYDNDEQKKNVEKSSKRQRT